MTMLKCVGCGTLRRLDIIVSNKPMVVYTCPYFPGFTTIRGLMRPGKRLERSVEECLSDVADCCIICGSTEKLKYYGREEFTCTCDKHDREWGDWLKKNPEKHEYFAPGGRVIRSNWVEVFREFVETMRPN